MGRPTIRDTGAMSPTEYQRRWRAKVRQQNDAVIERRIDLADEVRRGLGLKTFGLAAGIHRTFSTDRLTDQFLADLPMWEVPFYVIANRMKEAAGGRLVIDHAWWLIADGRSGEPWGFVTEPYLEHKTARALAAKMNRRHRAWGVTVVALPPERSPWLPGSTVPIVTTIGVGQLHEFLRHGVGAALAAMARGG